MPISEDLAAVREDVAYIKGKIEDLPDHETRIRALERFKNAVPTTSAVALIVAVVSAVITLHS